jgi:uncharacterized protein (TIGR03086 family)
MDTMDAYRRAQDGFEAVLRTVAPDRWDSPSMCAEWAVGDVAGHVIWAQHQLQSWATGTTYTERAGAPGSPHPATMTGPDPVWTWREARTAGDASLTDTALSRTTIIPGVGEIPVAAVIPLLITDLVTHTWDIGHVLAVDVRLPADLVALAFDWARANAVRAPGFFGPELTPPDNADEQTRMLAFLGRAAWESKAGARTGVV